MKAAIEEVTKKNEETVQNFFEMDKVHRKLSKENKELQNKHEHTCSEMRSLRGETEHVLKENNNLSIALNPARKT